MCSNAKLCVFLIVKDRQASFTCKPLVPGGRGSWGEHSNEGVWKVESGGKQKIKTTPVIRKSSFPDLVELSLTLSSTWKITFHG